MNRKTKKRTILLTLVILLSTPFIYWQSQKKVELYVNPAFRISDYDSFYVEYEDNSFQDGTVDTDVRDILRASGFKG